METDNGRTKSVWMATADTPGGGRLAEDISADVCIVGAGVAGLSVGYHLSREGKKVVLLDDGPTAGGETSRTSAHLSFINDDSLTVIESLHGFEGLKLSTESHIAAVDRIEQIVRDEKIDCNFIRVNGYLFVTPGGESFDFLERELDAAQRIGLADAHFVDSAPIPNYNTSKALCYPRQGRFHPLRYMAGLASAIQRRGGRIFNQTHAAKITGGHPARVETAQGRVVTCDAVVVTTNSPINDLVTMHTKQAAYRTYMLGFKIRKGALSKDLFWDTLDPYHYVRTAEYNDTHEILTAGGEDHKTGHHSDPAARFKAIEDWARPRFRDAEEILFRWSGQTIEPVDCLGYIGRNPLDKDNVFIATGDSGMGLTHSTIAGMLIPDLILNRPNPWEKLYDPARKPPLKSVGRFAQENLDVAVQYGSLLTPGEVKDVSEIQPDSGAIVRRGATKLAVYRDPSGQLHERSAICPHLGCVLAWNPAEKSWDCPCHGSRFNAQGVVVNGPANTDLPVG